jgi:hypothetical protein
MSRNNFFVVDPVKEPNKYWIFKELQEKQAVIIEDVSKKDWWDKLSIDIGLQSKEVILDKERVIMPTAKSRNQDVGYIVRKPNITLEELKKGAISRFIPKRIDGK